MHITALPFVHKINANIQIIISIYNNDCSVQRNDLYLIQICISKLIRLSIKIRFNIYIYVYTYTFTYTQRCNEILRSGNTNNQNILDISNV